MGLGNRHKRQSSENKTQRKNKYLDSAFMIFQTLKSLFVEMSGLFPMNIS